MAFRVPGRVLLLCFLIAFADLVNAQTPTVSDVRFDFQPDGSDTYGLGEAISIAVTFDQIVLIAHGEGREQELRERQLLRLALDVGGTTREAVLWSAGGSTLRFAYFVQGTDIDGDGISIPSDALTLNGATLKNLGGTIDVDLGLGANMISNAPGHKVDGTMVMSPTVEFVQIRVFDSRERWLPVAPGDTFLQGETIWIEVDYGHSVAVTGTPLLALNIGDAVRQARYVAWADPENPRHPQFGHPSILLQRVVPFQYVVVESDLDVDGISIGANALIPNGGAIKLQGSTTDAALTLPTITNPGHIVDGSRIRGGGSESSGLLDVRVESAEAALRVSWQVMSGASAYKVQWRVVGGAWSSSRQVETEATQYQISGLDAGNYEVRVIAVVDGEDGETSEPVRGEVAELDNQGPQVVDELPDVELDVGATMVVDVSDVSAAFEDADEDRLHYSAASDEGFVTVRVVEGSVHVGGVRPGAATVSVTAADASGRSATTTFQVAVGTLLSIQNSAVASEGGTVVLALELSRPLAVPVAARWRLVADEDASTADADMADYGEATGEVSIPAGEISATIEIAIVDDMDIEPAREHFVVQLEQPEDENAGLARNARAEVMIQEGVCDRTPAVRDELSRRWQGCQWPKPFALAALRSLDLTGRNINALRSNDLLGLRGLHRLDLSDNALERCRGACSRAWRACARFPWKEIRAHPSRLRWNWRG